MHSPEGEAGHFDVAILTQESSWLSPLGADSVMAAQNEPVEPEGPWF